MSTLDTDIGKEHILSLAVFAFAVEDMNALERVITSARPFAFLHSQILAHKNTMETVTAK